MVACGSVSSTHGVPGLENCFQLKTIADAQAIRRRILDNFETACLPTTTAEERKRLLSFVVCGGGPTGVEMAAEIYDLCQEDIVNYVRFNVLSYIILKPSQIVPENLPKGGIYTYHPIKRTHPEHGQAIF